MHPLIAGNPRTISSPYPVRRDDREKPSLRSETAHRFHYDHRTRCSKRICEAFAEKLLTFLEIASSAEFSESVHAEHFEGGISIGSLLWTEKEIVNIPCLLHDDRTSEWIIPYCQYEFVVVMVVFVVKDRSKAVCTLWAVIRDTSGARRPSDSEMRNKKIAGFVFKR